jgi:hypothetical protein
MAATPTFTLVGETSGGPPTTYTWTRDGVEITNSSSDSISLSLNTVPMEPDTPENRIAYLGSLYRSTLTVTGIFPGVYQYSASNRATATPSTESFNIEGMYIIMYCYMSQEGGAYLSSIPTFTVTFFLATHHMDFLIAIMFQCLIKI